jgi:hypothetical protein
MLQTRGDILRGQVILRVFAQANNRNFAGADPELNTTKTENDSEMKKDAEERKLHRMVNVQDCLEI